MPQADLLSAFLELTDSIRSPREFRLWAGIAMIAGALERRVWVPVGPYQAFPNLYTLLVAPPGIGKQIIDEVAWFWESTIDPITGRPAFHVSPTSMTQASLVDALVRARTVRTIGKGPPVEYSALLVPSEEFQVLVPKFEPEFIGRVTKIWGNPASYSEERRSGPVKEAIAPFPQLNILAGAQPGMLQATFPEIAWSTGFTARFVMVYDASEPVGSPFQINGYNIEAKQRVLSGLAELSGLYGWMTLAPEAQKRLEALDSGADGTRPTHSRLEHYTRRRLYYAVKLTTVSAIARGLRPGDQIPLGDVERALEWLLAAERAMPDIFRAMVGRSDNQVLEELYHYLTACWRASGGKPVASQRLERFLAERVPGEKIERLVMVAERIGMMDRLAGSDAYKPRARDGNVLVE